MKGDLFEMKVPRVQGRKGMLEIFHRHFPPSGCKVVMVSGPKRNYTFIVDENKPRS